MLFQIAYSDSSSTIIQFPKPGTTMFPEEKVQNEVAIIQYIQDHTSIPVPFILHWEQGKKVLWVALGGPPNS